MGLTVIQTELASTLGYKSIEQLEKRCNPSLANQPPLNPQDEVTLEQFRLAQEVQTSARSAVDVLSDLLNFDKIEHGELQLELTVIPFWNLIEQTVNEFRLAASNKNIQLALDLSDVLAKSDTESPETSHEVEMTTTDRCWMTLKVPKSWEILFDCVR